MRRLRTVAALGTALLLVTGCSGSGTFEEGGEDNGGPTAEAAGDGDDAAAGGGDRLVIAQPSDIDTMDPAMHRTRITQAVVRNVFEALVNQDTDLSFVPELAEDWEAVDDTTWRFQLRQGVTFHNGEPFNAEAVKFSLERVLDEDQGSPRASMLEMIDSVEVEDEHIVVIRTAEPAPTLLASLSVNEIVPPEYVQEVGDEAFAEAPIGTGPFTFVEWQPNERVVLEANPDHWDGEPGVSEVVFRPIPEVSARMAALESGEVHIAAEVPPDLAEGLGDGVSAAPVDGTRIWFLAMNVEEAPLDSADARVAVNQAIDRDSLVNDLLLGYARPLYQPAFPEMVGYSEEYEGHTFDADAAGEVLGQADGSVEIDAEEKDRTLAEAVAGQLQAAGLETSVNILETQAFLEKIESGASQAYLSSWGVAEGDADVIFARHFWSPSREEAVFTGYENAEVDTLIEEGRSIVDEEQREQIYAEAVEKVMADAPWAPLLNAQEIYGVSDRVQGFEPSPIGRYVVNSVTLGD